MKIINKIPVLHVLFMIGASLGFQLRFFYPSLINKLILKTTTIITNGRGDKIIENLLRMSIF